MVKFGQKLFLVTVCSLLSACVTQNYDKDTPVIEQNSSKNELALTRVSLGLGYLKMGNTSQAKFNLEKAKKFSPNLVEVHTAFAHYYETVDEPELTIQSYETALSIKDDDANTLNNYGVFLCRQEKYEAAEKQFLKAIAIPSYLLVSESYENLASCQIKAGNFEEAEFYLSKAITHSPNRGSAIFQMIRLEYAMGNYKKARSYTQKFEKVTRRFKPESLALAYKVYEQLGDRKTARNYGSMLVSMYPTSWEAKQYVLNGLQRVDADDLADEYKLLTQSTKKNKKRVIVLSPKNKDTALAQKAAIPETVTQEEPIQALESVSANVDGTNSQIASAQKNEAQLVVDETTAIEQANTQALADVTVSSVDSNTATLVSDSEQTVIVAAAMTKPDDFETLDPIDPQLEMYKQETEQGMNAESSTSAEVQTSETIGAIEENAVDSEVKSEVENTVHQLSDEEKEQAMFDELAALQQTAEQGTTSDSEFREFTIEENLADDQFSTDNFSTDTAKELEATETDVETMVNEEAENLTEFVASESNENTVNQDEPRPFHTVEKGDNLYGISLKYNIKLEALQRWNSIEENGNINIGDKIYIEESLVAEGTDEQ